MAEEAACVSGGGARRRGSPKRAPERKEAGRRGASWAQRSRVRVSLAPPWVGPQACRELPPNPGPGKRGTGMEGHGRRNGQLRKHPGRSPRRDCDSATATATAQSVPVAVPHAARARAHLGSPRRSAGKAARGEDAAGRLINPRQRRPRATGSRTRCRARRDNETGQATATAEDPKPDDVSTQDEVPRHPHPAPRRGHGLFAVTPEKPKRHCLRPLRRVSRFCHPPWKGPPGCWLGRSASSAPS